MKRAFANPLPVGSVVRIQGRTKECANLIVPTDRLLDIGCSSGWLAEVVLSKGVAQYVGLDRWIDGNTVDDKRLRLVAGSVFELPFEDESFDAVSLFDVIEHLPRRTEAAALREAHRVVRPGGRLYFSTPHASPIHAPLDPVWYFGHRHYRRATVKRLIGSAGFRVDRLFVAGGVTECMDHLRLLAYKHLLRRQLPSLAWIDRLVERTHGRDRWLGATIFAVGTK